MFRDLLLGTYSVPSSTFLDRIIKEFTDYKTGSVLSPKASTALVEGKISKNLKKILKKIVSKDAHEQLAVADAKLGGVIKVKSIILYAMICGILSCVFKA